MAKATIPVALTAAHKVAINFLLNVVRRCGSCGVTLLAAESGQHVKRHCELLDALELEAFEEMPREQSDRILREGLAEGAPRAEYKLSFEAARYLLGQLERRIRYAPLYWAIEPLTCELKTTLDVTFYREDYEKMGRKVIVLTTEERERLLLVYQTAQFCTSCGIIQDGPANLVELQHRARAFELLGLRGLMLDEESGTDDVEIVIEEPVIPVLKDLIANRALILPGGPRKLTPIITKLESAKAWEAPPLRAVADDPAS